MYFLHNDIRSEYKFAFLNLYQDINLLLEFILNKNIDVLSSQ
jgi:hypothetical protein